MGKIDYGFIRLKPTFEEAKNLSDSGAVNIFYNDQIQLLPNEHYSFITNIEGGLAFNNNVEVFLVNCKDEVLKDITANINIEEFIDDTNGTPQLKWEVASIGQDFYKQNVYFKFVHTESELKYWSNPVIVSDYESHLTTRFDYTNYQNLDGFNYNVAQIYQSIRLRCYLNKPTIQSKSSEYTTLNGSQVTSRLIKTYFEEFTFDNLDGFTYSRLITLLSHDVIFINGNKVTNKQTFEFNDRYSATTNISDNKFKVAIDYNQTYEPTFQIFEPLQLIIYNPNGIYTPQIEETGVYSSVYSNIYA